MERKTSNERLLNALNKKTEGPQLSLSLSKGMKKLVERKKLNSHEFHEIYASLFKPGPFVKYVSPEKWERVVRDHSARDFVTQ